MTKANIANNFPATISFEDRKTRIKDTQYTISTKRARMKGIENTNIHLVSRYCIRSIILLFSAVTVADAFLPSRQVIHRNSYAGFCGTRSSSSRPTSEIGNDDSSERNKNSDGMNGDIDISRGSSPTSKTQGKAKEQIVIIGAGWGGLSAAHALSSSASADDMEITVIEASPKVGGLVRDGFTTMSGTRPAEAGQHGFWNNYYNIYKLLEALPNIDIQDVLTDFAPQGQYSPNGLEAVWPIYKDQPVALPTGLAQAAYTKFNNLSIQDRLTAFPLVMAFSEFDDSMEAWEKFYRVSFRDLCMRLGVSKKCYDEAFEPMILTGLFAPGEQCSAAAALGMAYFFVLKSQTSFDVQWCKGNIGDKIFSPWVQVMEEAGVTFQTDTRVVGFDVDDSNRNIHRIQCRQTGGEEFTIQADKIVFAVGGEALSKMVQFSPDLAKYPDFRRFVNLRGTSVLATRIFLDQTIDIPYTANACWGFDDGVGMTMFDITSLHGSKSSTVEGTPGSVIEVDYYHASDLLVLDDDAILEKVKRDLDTILDCKSTKVVDAAVVRLPTAVNWYYPGSYRHMPDVESKDLHNAYFVGDIVRTRHGSWSQEKAYVTGLEAANLIQDRPLRDGIIPLEKDELHVQFGKDMVSLAKRILGGGDPSRGPSLVDFLL